MSPPDREPSGLLRIALISVHGLIRGHDLELGRDADTGGQTRYVVELARALGRHRAVGRVDLFTRLVAAPELDADYAELVEPLGECARIRRVEAGDPRLYLPKEQLWDHLDAFVDGMAELLRADEALPHLLHSHYADAGHVGSRLAHLLGLPLVHTGHSLGRVKRRRLLASGESSSAIDERYAMTRRIEAEEDTLAAAERVITSTHQEIEEQYALYDHYQPDSMAVVPPGTDLTLFHPPTGDDWDSAPGRDLRRFLSDPDRPLVLALSRPDPRKNLGALVDAFGTTPALREAANLVLVAGNRDDIDELEEGAREVLTELLLAIDRHDLHGVVAYPKHHLPEDVPVLYRLAAASGGVFVNPALTEPFGLTLIEAAASGLPVVATEDGGPRDITANCENGLLVDPLDTAAIAEALLALLGDRPRWERLAAAGLDGVARHYSWDAHVRRYLDVVEPLVAGAEPRLRPALSRRATLFRDRALFSDLDQSLLGDPDSLPRLAEVLARHRNQVTFGVATGRRLDSALRALQQHGLPVPDVLITSAGTAIHSQPGLTADAHWARHIDHAWTPHVAPVVAHAQSIA